MGDGAQPQAGDESLRATVARLTGAVLGLLRTRGELAAVEYAEERTRVGRQFTLLIAGVACLMFAVVFAAAAVIVYFWDTHRFAAIIGVILAFAVAGIAMLWRRAEISHTAPIPFTASLAEIDKDRVALAALSPRGPRPPPEEP